MKRNHSGAARALLVSAVWAAAVGAAPTAWAHGGEGVSPDTSRPPSPPGEGASAEQIVKALEAKKRDPALAKVVVEPLRQAKAALERARGARVAGDTAHARMLDAVALEWAETARDLERAAGAEAAAAAAAAKSTEVATRVERARTLLEETQARRGRAALELERVEAEARDAAASAASAEQSRIDASKKKPGKAEKKATDEKKPATAEKPKAEDKPASDAASKDKPKKGAK